MKKNLFKLFVFMLAIQIMLISCEEENNDVTAPGQIVNAVAIGQDLSVLIQWTDPSDSDLDKIIISYTDEIEYNVEVFAGVGQKSIENLSNDQEYSFKLIAVDISGNESEEVIITATPELSIYRINGIEIENGTYRNIDDNSFIITYVFSGTNILNTSLTAGVNNFSWTGSWSRDDQSVITVMTNTTGGTANRDSISSAFCFELESGKYYYHGAYEKTSGEDDEIIGFYEYSITDKSKSSFSKSIEISSDGTFDYSEDGSIVNSGTWTNDDIRSKNYVLIDFMGKTFLYWENSFVLKKQ